MLGGKQLHSLFTMFSPLQDDDDDNAVILADTPAIKEIKSRSVYTTLAVVTETGTIGTLTTKL